MSDARRNSRFETGLEGKKVDLDREGEFSSLQVLDEV